MNLDNAKIGWEKTWRASGKAKSTLILYSGFLGQLSGYLKNPEISDITLEKLEDYFIYLQEEYIPKRKFGVIKRLSGSSLANHWKAIRSIMKWCIERKFMLENDDPSLKLNCPKAVNEAVTH